MRAELERHTEASKNKRNDGTRFLSFEPAEQNARQATSTVAVGAKKHRQSIQQRVESSATVETARIERDRSAATQSFRHTFSLRQLVFANNK
jgi:hypothetical protein